MSYVTQVQRNPVWENKRERGGGRIIRANVRSDNACKKFLLTTAQRRGASSLLSVSFSLRSRTTEVMNYQQAPDDVLNKLAIALRTRRKAALARNFVGENANKLPKQN